MTHLLSALILGVFPLDQNVHIGNSPSRNLKLISHEPILEVFHPVWKSVHKVRANIRRGSLDRETPNDSGVLENGDAQTYHSNFRL